MPWRRTRFSILTAKATALASRALQRGGGTAVSGLVALWLQPDLVEELASDLDRGSVVVTGTNGKTTTSLLISRSAESAGLQPLANTSGSNLMRGIASTLALSRNGSDAARNTIGVFEVDEAALTQVLPAVRPRVAVFTNLFRDQLDRYGEVDAVASRWRELLSNTPPGMELVLNADDPTVASLGEGREDCVYFGVEGRSLGHEKPEHAADALTCICGARLEYSLAFFGHVGHWRCPACKRKRPRPQVAARRVELADGRSARFELELQGEKTSVQLGLGGLYNVYNALAAAAAGQALGLPREAILAGLGATEAAFGRQEAFEIEGRRVELFLGKNPAGLNQVLSTLLLDPARRHVLFILNDGIADGRDVSWIWDADFEVAAGKLDRVFTSGSRAAEMALRLKYAEWSEAQIEVDPEIPRSLQRALELTAKGACLTIVPTYTAMLTVRELLAKRAGKEPFWR